MLYITIEENSLQIMIQEDTVTDTTGEYYIQRDFGLT